MTQPNQPIVSRHLELGLLELFDTISRTSNLTAAGEKLGLSQPAVSRGLARLREIYDDPLFVRQQRGVQPTPFAQQLFEPIASALAILRSTVGKPVFSPAKEQRCFNLAMSDIGERYFMTRLVRHLSHAAPKVTVRVLSPDRASLLAGLASGDIDMGLGYFPDLGKQVRVKRLFKERFTYVARKGHPRVSQRMEIEDLRQLQHVVANPPGTQHAATVQRVLGARRIQAPISHELHSFLCVGPLISETDLVSVVPLNLAKLVAEHLHLQIVQPPVRFPGFDVSMVWHQRYDREAGRMWLRAVFSELFQRDE
jgi:DNA-binding transcriptional LysR family regulator